MAVILPKTKTSLAGVMTRLRNVCDPLKILKKIFTRGNKSAGAS